MRKHTRIKDLPVSERPQERLFRSGGESVTLAELFAVLIGTGTRQHSALQLANAVVRSLPEATAASLEESIRRISAKGFGKVKKARCLAALELGKRLYAPSNRNNVLIKNGSDVITHISGINKGHQERLYAFYINARNELIKKELIVQGTLNITRVSVRDVLSNALLFPCAALVIVHNHPSGDATPSDEDIIFTDYLQRAAELLNILLIDHLILGNSNYFSFHDNMFRGY